MIARHLLGTELTCLFPNKRSSAGGGGTPLLTGSTDSDGAFYDMRCRKVGDKMRRLFGLCCAVLAVVACSSHREPVETIWATVRCEEPCVSQLFRIEANDSYEFENAGFRKHYFGRVKGLHALATSLLDAAIENHVHPSVSPPPHGGHRYFVDLNVLTGGETRTYTLFANHPSPSKVNEFWNRLDGVLSKDVYRQKRAIMQSIAAYDDLDEVVISQRPFFHCYFAELRSTRGGLSSLRFPDGKTVTISRELFPRLVSILREEDASSLSEDYPVRFKDLEGVHISLRYKRFHYNIDAIDRTTWPFSLTNIVARTDEAIIENAVLSDLKKCLSRSRVG